jgi:hypothetical protein
MRATNDDVSGRIKVGFTMVGIFIGMIVLFIVETPILFVLLDTSKLFIYIYMLEI